jgi:hypothetical protein
MPRRAALDVHRVAACLAALNPDESLTVGAERRWRELRPVAKAAADVEWFLKRRPDLDSGPP